MASLDLGQVVPDIPNKIETARPYVYEGENLLSKFDSIAELSTVVRAGDFSKINLFDFIKVTLSGSFYDYATSTTKNINQDMYFEAMPDFYINTNGIDQNHHILFLSRDLLGQNLQMRSAIDTWYDANANNPWLGSHLYQTFNNKTNGIRALMERTILQGYIYDPDGNGGGITQYAEQKAKAATAASDAWNNCKKGALFLPTETEVWGHAIWSEAKNHPQASAQGSLQWPVFVGNMRHVHKSNTIGGSRNTWWCCSSVAGSATGFCYVDHGGVPASYGAALASVGAPVGFLFR